MERNSSISYSNLFSSGYFKGLDQLFDSSVFSEDGKEFKAHMLILSKGSGYFRASFRNSFIKNVLTHGIDGKILENILIFLYRGDVYLDEENISSVVMAADYLLMDDLLNQCRFFAVQNISLRSCIPLLGAAWFVKNVGIEEYCYRYVLVHFGSLVQANDSRIAKLPLDVLIKLLRDNSLGVNNEEVVWMAIQIWATENTSDRLQHIPRLLSYLRINHLHNSLINSIADNSLVKNNPFCHNSSEKFELTNYGIIDSLIIKNLSDRVPRTMHLFLGTLRNTNGKLDMFLTYDGELDMWRKIGETSFNFDTLIPVGRSVLMFDTISNEIESFDLKLKTWSHPSLPSTSRMGYHVVSNRDRIFVIGGNISMTEASDVEYYLTSIDSWFYISPLPSMDISGVAVLNDRIYVVGLAEEFGRLELKAKVYDILLESWSDIAKPKIFRMYFTIVSFRQRIYVLGGRSRDDSTITSVETYSPEKEWDVFPDLPVPYQMPQAIVLRENLVVYEDDPLSGRLRYPPSIWNEDSLIWNLVDVFSPLIEIHRYHFCTIEDNIVLRELMKENTKPETIWVKSPFSVIHNG